MFYYLFWSALFETTIYVVGEVIERKDGGRCKYVQLLHTCSLHEAGLLCTATIEC